VILNAEGPTGPNPEEGPMNATTATPITILLGDAVQARFLMEGNLIVRDGAVYRVGAARVVARDGRISLSLYNHLGGIEGELFDPQELVPLATAL
jgi:hypothetical protein